MKKNLWCSFILLSVLAPFLNAQAKLISNKGLFIVQDHPSNQSLTLGGGTSFIKIAEELKSSPALNGTTKDIIEKIENNDEKTKSDVRFWFTYVQKENPNSPDVLEVAQALMIQNIPEIVEFLFIQNEKTSTVGQALTMDTLKKFIEMSEELLNTNQVEHFDAAMESIIKKVVHQAMVHTSLKERMLLANFIADKISKEDSDYLKFMTEPLLFEATSDRQKEEMIKRAISDQNEESIIKVIHSIDPPLIFNLIVESHALVGAAKQNEFDLVKTILILAQRPEVKKLAHTVHTTFQNDLNKARMEAEEKEHNGIIFLLKTFELQQCESQKGPLNSSETRRDFLNWILVSFISRNILPTSAHQWLWMKDSDCNP